MARPLGGLGFQVAPRRRGIVTAFAGLLGFVGFVVLVVLALYGALLPLVLVALGVVAWAR